MLDIIEVASGDDPSVIDEQARSQFVTAEHRHQILQGASVMNIAVEDLVKQRKTFRLGYPQADLDQGPAFDFLFVLPRFGQRTVATVEVGVGDIIDHPGGSEPILAADLFKESPLPSLGVQGFQTIQGTD